jgi:nucleoid-associated protein YgaU
MGLSILNRSQAVDDLAAAPDALATPTSFVIRETTGRKRTVTMSGRCLPFRPVPLSTQQRSKITYYPGATEATAQVFGPHHTDLEVTGLLLTRYMASDVCFFLEEPGSAGEIVDTAERAREVLNDLCRSGQEVVVSWGQEPFGVIQRGLVRSVKFPEESPYRIAWEMAFDWIADTELHVAPLLPAADQPAGEGLLDQIDSAINTAQSVLTDLQDAYREYVVQTMRRIDTTRSKVAGLVAQAADLAAKPAQAASNALLMAQSVKQDLVDTQTAAIQTAGAYTTIARIWQATGHNLAFTPWTATRDRPGDDSGEQTISAVQAAEMDRSRRAMRWQAYVVETQARASMTNPIRDVYVVVAGDTLRRISTRYYGTPDRWQDLADYNGISTDELTAGMVVLIPEVP